MRRQDLYATALVTKAVHKRLRYDLGRRTGQTTPVQLVLAPGTYSIGVEKDGRQAVQTVEVRDGLTSLRIQLGQ